MYNKNEDVNEKSYTFVRATDNRYEYEHIAKNGTTYAGEQLPEDAAKIAKLAVDRTGSNETISGLKPTTTAFMSFSHAWEKCKSFSAFRLSIEVPPNDVIYLKDGGYKQMAEEYVNKINEEKK